jgi:hypothetical protein
MSAPIFISYSSKDQGVAETICQALEARGIACWISCRDVHPGENFQEAIVRALRTARVMLLVFTSNANNSDEIKKELVLAGRHRVTVVPVRVEDVVPNDAFAYEFATRQWIDLYKNWEQEIELLATRIGKVLETAKPQDGGQAAAPAKAIPPVRFGKRTSYWLPLAAAALVVIFIAAGAAAWYLRPAAAPATSAPSPVASASSPAAAPPPVASTPSPAVSTPPPVASAPPPAVSIPPPAASAPPAAPAPLPVAAAPSPARTAPFDGTWLTTLDCLNGGGGKAFVYRFFGEVKDSKYLGHQGDEGRPSWFQLEGTIEPGGAATLLASGIVGGSAFAAGRVPTGTHYTYPVKAQFTAAKGAGSRADGRRVCNLEFLKQ